MSGYLEPVFMPHMSVQAVSTKTYPLGSSMTSTSGLHNLVTVSMKLRSF